jgi:hypothetical protein
MTRDEFYQKQESGKMHWERCSPKEETVNPNDIIGGKEWNSEDKNFWNHHGRTKDEYMDYVGSGKADNAEPPEVNKCGDKYVLVNDGSHRVAASKELNRPIKVNVTGKYTEQSQGAEESDEEEMSM